MLESWRSVTRECMLTRGAAIPPRQVLSCDVGREALRRAVKQDCKWLLGRAAIQRHLRLQWRGTQLHELATGLRDSGWALEALSTCQRAKLLLQIGCGWLACLLLTPVFALAPPLLRSLRSPACWWGFDVSTTPVFKFYINTASAVALCCALMTLPRDDASASALLLAWSAQVRCVLIRGDCLSCECMLTRRCSSRGMRRPCAQRRPLPGRTQRCGGRIRWGPIAHSHPHLLPSAAARPPRDRLATASRPPRDRLTTASRPPRDRLATAA